MGLKLSNPKTMQKKLRKILADPFLFIPRLQIKNKKGKLVRFKLNAEQEEMLKLKWNQRQALLRRCPRPRFLRRYHIRTAKKKRIETNQDSFFLSQSHKVSVSSDVQSLSYQTKEKQYKNIMLINLALGENQSKRLSQVEPRDEDFDVSVNEEYDEITNGSNTTMPLAYRVEVQEEMHSE